ncbi:hypothetical protein FI667_g17433, partial [Globisporangium splendens]
MGSTLNDSSSTVAMRTRSKSRASSSSSTTVATTARGTVVTKTTTTTSSSITHTTSAQTAKLHTFERLHQEGFAYLADNSYIRSGYRLNYSVRDCFLSLFELHNETLNVWTHIIGSFIFLSLMMYLTLSNSALGRVGGDGSAVMAPSWCDVQQGAFLENGHHTGRLFFATALPEYCPRTRSMLVLPEQKKYYEVATVIFEHSLHQIPSLERFHDILEENVGGISEGIAVQTELLKSELVLLKDRLAHVTDYSQVRSVKESLNHRVEGFSSFLQELATQVGADITLKYAVDELHSLADSVKNGIHIMSTVDTHHVAHWPIFVFMQARVLLPLATRLRGHHDPDRGLVLPDDLLLVLLSPVAAARVPDSDLGDGGADVRGDARAGVRDAQVPRLPHVHLPVAWLLRAGASEPPGVPLRPLRPARDRHDRAAAAHGSALHARRDHLRDQVPGAVLPRTVRCLVLEPPALAHLRRGRGAGALCERAAAVRVAMEHDLRRVERERAVECSNIGSLVQEMMHRVEATTRGEAIQEQLRSSSRVSFDTYDTFAAFEDELKAATSPNAAAQSIARQFTSYHSPRDSDRNPNFKTLPRASGKLELQTDAAHRNDAIRIPTKPRATTTIGSTRHSNLELRLETILDQEGLLPDLREIRSHKYRDEIQTGTPFDTKFKSMASYKPLALAHTPLKTRHGSSSPINNNAS